MPRRVHRHHPTAVRASKPPTLEDVAKKLRTVAGRLADSVIIDGMDRIVVRYNRANASALEAKLLKAGLKKHFTGIRNAYSVGHFEVVMSPWMKVEVASSFGPR